MSKVNENKVEDLIIIDHFIKDLSYENPQNINLKHIKDDKDHDIVSDLKVTFRRLDKKIFSLILKYTLECKNKSKNEILCHLELDYFGLFQVTEDKYDQKNLTKHALHLIFPFAKEIVEYLSRKGGSIPVTLNHIDFKLKEN